MATHYQLVVRSLFDEASELISLSLEVVYTGCHGDVIMLCRLRNRIEQIM